MAPIAPYFADRLYRDLCEATGRDCKSVHLSRFPIVDETCIDREKELCMQLAQQVTSMVLSLRKKEDIIVRQPLQRIAIPATDAAQQQRIASMQHLILEEVNVKELEFVDGQGILIKKVKCNFRTMGKKFGKLMKSVSAAVEVLSQEEIAQLEQGNVTVTLSDGQQVCIERDDVEIYSEDIPGWTVANEGSLTVALDIQITQELRQEGIAREIVKRIQNLRKESGFEITDRICITIEHNEQTDGALEKFRDYICAQVLADSLDVTDSMSVDSKMLDLDDFQVKVLIEKK